MNLRQTHTIVEMGVSQPAYDEIKSKLRAAGYDHVFGDEGLMDMSGIGLSLDPDAEARVTVGFDCAGPTLRQLTRMAYLLRLVPQDQPVHVDLLPVLRDQFNAAVAVWLEPGATNG